MNMQKGDVFTLNQMCQSVSLSIFESCNLKDSYLIHQPREIRTDENFWITACFFKVETPKPDTSREDMAESALSFIMLFEGLASLSQMSAEL